MHRVASGRYVRDSRDDPRGPRAGKPRSHFRAPAGRGPAPPHGCRPRKALMSEWWTYRLSDLLLFSPRTYYRLFELYNAAIWPAQIVAVALGLAVLLLGRGQGSSRGRWIAALLAGCWLWVAIAFHANRYASINWAAVDFAWGFGCDAALLIWTGVLRGRLVFGTGEGATSRAARGIFLFALLAQPLIGPLCG